MTKILQISRARPGKRAQILAAATALFHQTHNVKKVTIIDIAARARVSPATVYNQFGSREALVMAVAETLISDIISGARRVLRRSGPFSDKLERMIASKMDLLDRTADEVIAKIVSQDAAMAPFIAEVFNRQVRPLWLEILADGKKQGYIDPSLDGEVFLAYVDILRAGFSVRPDILNNWRQNRAFIDKLTGLFFYGFLTKEINLSSKKE